MRAALRRKGRAVLYCLPCGGGKGTLCSVMVQTAVQRGLHVIFAVHGRSLVQDMSQRVRKLGIPHGVLMGGSKREHWHQVQVASIDTLHRMKNRPQADLIIIDEARTFMSVTGRLVVDDYPDAKIIGLDATPARLDGKGLGVEFGGIFNAMVMGPSEQELIDLEFLVPSIPIGIAQAPDVSKVGKSGGDFNQKALAEVCNKTGLVGDIVEHWLREAPGRKTVAFAVDREHARHITQRFLDAGVEWAYVDANTPNAERLVIWDRLANGTLMGVANCGICLVGWDLPRISCLISARPTASLTLWRQMMGRGSRIHPESGKKDFIILDHAGNFIRHHPYGFFEIAPTWSLAGTAKRADTAPEVAMCKIPIPVPLSGVPKTFKGPLSKDGLFMMPSFHVFEAGPEFCPFCGIPLKLEITAAEREKRERALAAEAEGRLRNLAALRAAAMKEAELSPPKAFFFKHFEESVKRHFKIGYATYHYKERYGEWPKPRWKKEAIAIYGTPERK